MEYYCFNCKLVFSLKEEEDLNCENCNSDFIESYKENNSNKPNNFNIYDKNQEENKLENFDRTISFNFNHDFVRNTLYPIYQRSFETSRIINYRRRALSIVRYIFQYSSEDEISFKTSKKFIDELKNYKIENNKKIEEECSICKENFENEEIYNILPCEHHFHNKCLRPWLELNYSCPNCRNELPKEKIE